MGSSSTCVDFTHISSKHQTFFILQFYFFLSYLSSFSAGDLNQQKKILILKSFERTETQDQTVQNATFSCDVKVSTPFSPPEAGILAEPYKPTNFILSYTCEGENAKNVNLSLFSESSENETATGGDFYFTYKILGQGQLKVLACLEEFATRDGCKYPNSTQEFLFPVVVTYVRREIRNMSSIERGRYFDAIKTLKNYSTVDGQKQFGPGFTSYDDIVGLHMAAVWVHEGRCDMGHHGPALTTFHRAIVRLFEKSIQAVDPSLASPYWDYLRDGGLLSPDQSFIWSDSYFGNIGGDPDHNHQVMNGQFANWTVPFGDKAIITGQITWGSLGPSNIVNPYGYFRSKDSANPNPYITRYGPNTTNKVPPTTENWVQCANFSDFGAFSECLDTSSVHPGLHILTGGVAQLPTFDDVKDSINCSGLNTTEDCQTAFAAALVSGGSYRYQGVIDGCLVCDRTCTSLDQSPEECGCRCVQPTPFHCTPKEILLRFSNKLNLVISPDLAMHYEFVNYGVCATTRVNGDYSDGAGSANDPIFWVHHSNLDRLLVSWRSLYPIKSWASVNFTAPSSDPRYYPDVYSTKNVVQPSNPWPGVSFKGDLNPTGVCLGQGLYDEIAGGSFKGLFRSINSTNPHTNYEILESVDVQLNDPASADYIYDSYYEITI